MAPLSLGLSRSINMAAVMQPISELFRAFPGAELKVRRGAGEAIHDMLKDGEVELALAGPLSETWERLDRWRIFAEPMSIIVNRDHRLARQNEIEMQHLCGERFLTLVSCEMAKAQRDYLSAHGISGTNTHEVETDHDLVALLEANAGLAIMPASAPPSAVLCRPVVRFWELQRDVSVYGVAGRQRAPAATTLLNLLRAAEWPDCERPAQISPHR